MTPNQEKLLRRYKIASFISDFASVATVLLWVLVFLFFANSCGTVEQYPLCRRVHVPKDLPYYVCDEPEYRKR